MIGLPMNGNRRLNMTTLIPSLAASKDQQNFIHGALSCPQVYILTCAFFLCLFFGWLFISYSFF